MITKAIIKKYHSKRIFKESNYVVFYQVCQPKIMIDGTRWNGRSTIGHFKFLSEAKQAQSEFNSTLI
jgi:hypothetical protein